MPQLGSSLASATRWNSLATCRTPGQKTKQTEGKAEGSLVHASQDASIHKYEESSAAHILRTLLVGFMRKKPSLGAARMPANALTRICIMLLFWPCRQKPNAGRRPAALIDSESTGIEVAMPWIGVLSLLKVPAARPHAISSMNCTAPG